MNFKNALVAGTGKSGISGSKAADRSWRKGYAV